MNDKEALEKVYEKRAVWTETEPPKELVEIVETKKINPCKALDIGCGEGFYSIYLAKKGFDVTGIDLSENAVRSAKQNAKKENVKIKFIAMDTSELSKLNKKFDFILEWALLHHIVPKKRKKYAKDVEKILNKGGKYLSICFNNQNSDFGAEGKNLRTIPKGAAMPEGTKLYYSSLEEVKELFKEHFQIIETKLIKISTGSKPHIVNYLFMEKK